MWQICGRFPFFIIFFIEEIPKTILVITKTRICLHDTRTFYGCIWNSSKKNAFLILKVVKLEKMLWNEKKWQVFTKHINFGKYFQKQNWCVYVFGKNLSFQTKNAHAFSSESIFPSFTTVKSKNARFFAWIPNTLIECVCRVKKCAFL